MEAAESFRNNFKHLIEKSGTNPSAFAKSTRLSGPLVYAYLSGKNKPGLEQLQRIATAFSISVAELVGDEIPVLPPAPQPNVEEMRLLAISAILSADKPELETILDALKPLFDRARKKNQRRSSSA